MKIIVGLGNPGPRYAGTRHNVGFNVMDVVAHRLTAAFDHEKYHGLVADAQYAGEKTLLIKPLTYMNNSGECVARAMRYRPVDTADILVVADDVHLPVGKLRIRAAGTAGGHNGLKSIIQHVRTEDFSRLRIGVGEDKVGGGLTNHVLGRFTPEEHEAIAHAIPRAAEAVLSFIADGVEKAMNEFN